MCRKTNTETTQKSNEVVISENIDIPDEATTDSRYVDELSVELLGINRANISIRDTNNNKFMGYINLNRIYPEMPIGDVYVYEKYIVLVEFFQQGGEWYGDGFNVYEYDENIKYSEYKIKGNKLHECSGPYFFEGIYNDLLFSDIGTGPGIRGIEIFDLANNSFVLAGAYYGSFYFHNNIVNGLVFTKWSISRGSLEDSIIDKYNEYLETTYKPEETYGLFPELIMHYTYNILTHEIKLGSGEYILVQ
jgi:hypothetical protein